MLNETLLRSFLARQETEISRIPLELRRMPVRELGEKWSGGLKGVVEGLARGRVVEEQQEQEQQEEEEGEPRGKAAAKRYVRPRRSRRVERIAWAALRRLTGHVELSSPLLQQTTDDG